MKLDLAFDIDLAEGIVPGSLEKWETFSGKETKVFTLFFEEALTIVVDNELTGLMIGFESKFFSDESKADIWFIPKTC